MTPEQRQKYIQRIAKIESLPRPQKWTEIRKLFLSLHPEFIEMDKAHSEACKEIRQKSESKTGASKSLNLRNTMKIPTYVYNSLIKLDPELKVEMSGRNHGDQWRIGKQLYQAFPEYRIARSY
jgi:hypothetical protein